jgi:hypothetical protein
MRGQIFFFGWILKDWGNGIGFGDKKAVPQEADGRQRLKVPKRRPAQA